MSKTEYKAFVSIGNNELPNHALVSPSDTVSEVSQKLKKANNIRNAEILLFKDALVLNATKTLEEYELSLRLLESDKTYRFGGNIVMDRDINIANMPSKIASLEAQVAELVKSVDALKKLTKTQETEIRKRPKGWCKMLYPGNLVWVRPTNAGDPIQNPETLYQIHTRWLGQMNKNTEVYCVALNGPRREYQVEYQSATEGAEKVKLDIWCVRIILPMKDSDTIGAVREYDAIGGWKRTTHDTFTGNDVVENVKLLGDMDPSPNDTEYYMSPAVGVIIPTKDAKLE